MITTGAVYDWPLRLRYSIGIPSSPQTQLHHPGAKHPDVSDQSSPHHCCLACPRGMGEGPAESKAKPMFLMEPRKCGQDLHYCPRWQEIPCQILTDHGISKCCALFIKADSRVAFFVDCMVKVRIYLQCSHFSGVWLWVRNLSAVF